MYKPRIIIAISGKQRAGKNTAADYLMRVLAPFQFVQTGFANPLKSIVAAESGITVSMLESLKNHDPEWRSRLIKKAADLKADDPEVFIKLTLSKPGNLIITDMRYQAEADAVIASSPLAFLLRIVAPRDLRAKRGELSNEDDLSETDLDDASFDYVIDNYQTLAELQYQCDVVAESVADIVTNWTPLDYHARSF